MKKLICLLITLSMLLCSVTAFADVDTMFAAMTAPYLTAETETEFSVKLNSPLEFINILSEDEYAYISPVDFKMLAESAFDISEKAAASVVCSEDFKKMRLALQSELNLPLRFNDSLKTDIWAKVGIWMDVDITDVNKPVYKIIMKLPFSTKYMVMEYADMAKSGFDLEKYTSTIAKYSDAEFVSELNGEIMQLIKDNSTIREVSRNKEYTVFVDDGGIKAIVGGMLNKVIEIAKENAPQAAQVFDEEFYAQANMIGEKLNAVPILGKNGLKINVRLQNDKLSSVETVTDIKFNIYDFMALMEEDVSEYNRNDWLVDLTVSTKTTYSNLDGKVQVDMPELTESNSVSFDDPYGYNDYDDSIEIKTVYPIEAEQDKIMLPLRDCMSCVGIYDYSVSESTVEVNADAEKYGFKNAVFTVGSDKMLVDGAEIAMSLPVELNEAGLVIIPIDAIETMTVTKVSSVSISLEPGLVNEVTLTPVTEIDVVEEWEEFEGYDDYEMPESSMSEPSYYWYFSVDGTPVVRNKSFYLPARILMKKMGYAAENMSFDNGTFTIRSADGSPKEFDELVISENSAVVYINGTETVMSNPVIEVDGSMYVPAELLIYIDCELNSVNYRYNDNSYNVNVYRNKYGSSYGYNSYKYAPYMEYANISVQEEAPLVKDESGYYLPLRPFMGELMVDDESITADGDTVKIVGTHPATSFELMTISGNLVTIDGVEHTMNSSLKEVDGRKYVPMELFTEILGGKLTSVDVSYEEPIGTGFEGKIKNPLYEE